MSHDLLEALRVSLLARRKAPRTIDAYVAHARAFLEFLGVTTPTRREVELFLARPRGDGRQRSASSINQALASVRALAVCAVADGQWPSDPTAGFGMLREPVHEPTFLSRDEVRALFRAAAAESSPFERARDLAVLAVFLTSGLRVHELHALNVGQLDTLTGELLDVRGKGGTLHRQLLPAATIQLLERWLAERATVVVVGEQGLFVADTGRRWSMRGVQRRLGRLGTLAGITKRVTPHVLRHTVATLSLTLGVDLVTVADVLRHSDISVTRRYVHLEGERRRHAADLLERLIPADVLPLTETMQASVVSKPQGLDDEGYLCDTVSKVA